ncbi:hypothetical protein DFH08DRAFT_1011664 [Mycena albidolilacea]|uniref:Uncharacterized protein n=1 Tax=Mycena albidolilacea TaxID=1033008 RepID=A0AAD7EPT2_9AGAR|nr:hypothetical protein DFH08DRAFT_1011664 [Mycena albidolilacea]
MLPEEKTVPNNNRWPSLNTRENSEVRPGRIQNAAGAMSIFSWMGPTPIEPRATVPMKSDQYRSLLNAFGFIRQPQFRHKPHSPGLMLALGGTCCTLGATAAPDTLQATTHRLLRTLPATASPSSTNILTHSTTQPLSPDYLRHAAAIPRLPTRPAAASTRRVCLSLCRAAFSCRRHTFDSYDNDTQHDLLAVDDKFAAAACPSHYPAYSARIPLSSSAAPTRAFHLPSPLLPFAPANALHPTRLYPIPPSLAIPPLSSPRPCNPVIALQRRASWSKWCIL